MRTDTEPMSALIAKAQAGDTRAYDLLVRQLQDPMVAYAVSLLGDFHLAQDAAQNAFVQAYRDLPTLREPGAFVGWLRRIVFKYCDRVIRDRRLRTVPLEVLLPVPSAEPGPAESAERSALEASVQHVIQSLPPEERAVTTLFYMGARSYREIADFLEIPVTTVKSRLHSARGRLKEGMRTVMQDGLEGLRPSRGDEFAGRVRLEVVRALAQIAAGDIPETAIRQHHPGARYRAPHPVFALAESLMGWALTEKAHEIRLFPGEEGMTILFAQGETVRPAIELPGVLEEPIIARLKDGAGLDTETHGVAQEGSFPVYDSHEGKLYDMVVACSPVESRERVVLRLIPRKAE